MPPPKPCPIKNPVDTKANNVPTGILVEILRTATSLDAFTPPRIAPAKQISITTSQNGGSPVPIMINKIEAVGNYAIRIIFDDGHNTGIFSWEYIYTIGSRLQDS